MSTESKFERSERGWARPAVLEGVDFRRHLVVEASAGTGKTYTLERIVLELVADGAPIESILVVTFTDKAAREMRGRIRKCLEEARAEARRPTDRARLSSALASFDRAPIGTIHSFCQRVLGEHAFECGRSLVEERVDGRETFGRAFRDLLRRGLTQHHELHHVFDAALAVVEPSSTKGEASALEDLLYAWVREAAVIRPRFEPFEAARALLAVPDVEMLGTTPWQQKLSRVAARSKTKRARGKNENAQSGDQSDVVRRALEELAHAIAPHRDWLARTLERGEDPTFGPVWKPALSWGSQTVDAQRKKRYASICASAFAEVDGSTDPREPDWAAVFATLHRALASPVPYLVHALLPAVCAAWQADKRAHGWMDFDDMVLGLRDVLRTAPSVVRRLRARYRHALVDEFQDTDAAQWEIFRRLFVDREPGSEGSDEPARTLIAIGDPKQAIYGFRGADVRTFDVACRELERCGGQRVRLSESYRASARLLSGIDSILVARARERSFFSNPEVYPEGLSCGVPSRRAVGPEGEDVPAVIIQHLVGRDELKAESVRRSLADAIAREIRALVEGAVRWVDEGGPPRKPCYADVFVLTRGSNEAQTVVTALRRHGIPFVLFKEGGLYRSEEAHALRDLLRAIAAPHDRALRTRALLGPYFGVSLREIAAARALASDHPLVVRLHRWADLAARGRTATLLTSLLEDSGLARRALYLHASERSLVNHMHLLEQLLELATRRHLGVGELAAVLDARIAAAEDGVAQDEDIQRLESEHDAVQILTMHKSKGLEAEVVFLFGGLGRGSWNAFELQVFYEEGSDGAPQRVAWALPLEELDSESLRNDLEREVRAEDERLLYVAMTRARRRLYLPYLGLPPRPAEPRADRVYKYSRLHGSYRVLVERLAAMGELGVLVPPAFEVRTIEVGDPPRERLTRPLPPAQALSLIPVPSASESELERLASEHLGIPVTSYTRLRAEAERMRRGLAEDESRREYDEVDALSFEPPALERHDTTAPLVETPGGANFGVLVHELIEAAVCAGLGPELDVEALRALPEVVAILEEDGSGEASQTLALEFAVRALATPIRDPLLDLKAGVAAVPRKAAEVPFLFAVPDESAVPWRAGPVAVRRGLVKGVIDLLFEHEGRMFILDWKTDQLDRYDRASLAEQVHKGYGLQVALYTLAALRYLVSAECGKAAGDLFERAFGGVVYVFLRGLEGPLGQQGCLVLRPSWKEVEGWETEMRDKGTLLGHALPRATSGLATPKIQGWLQDKP